MLLELFFFIGRGLCDSPALTSSVALHCCNYNTTGPSIFTYHRFGFRKMRETKVQSVYRSFVYVHSLKLAWIAWGRKIFKLVFSCWHEFETRCVFVVHNFRELLEIVYNKSFSGVYFSWLPACLTQPFRSISNVCHLHSLAFSTNININLLRKFPSFAFQFYVTFSN